MGEEYRNQTFECEAPDEEVGAMERTCSATAIIYVPWLGT